MNGGAAAPSASPIQPRLPHELALAALFVLALTLFVLGPVLFGNADRVLSNEDADLAMQFVHWRAFGFSEMRAGHLPLWNPHIFCGAPFLGGFQSALLYPPNWLYLILPMGRAINIGIALHVFLAGFFMYLWARERSLTPLACAFAAVLFMFSGPYFPHIDGGHLPNLCAMVWGPLLFLAIDRWLERRSAGALLLGGGAVALQILAGHPQYVFYTGIAAGIYCLLALPAIHRPWRAAAGLALIPLLGAALSAAQLLEGFHAAGESLRSRGVGLVFASMFSFAPENFLTLLAPGFFGGGAHSAYWGRCSFSELSLFFGVTGLILALYGVFHGCRRSALSGRLKYSEQLRLFALVAVLLLLALGSHTPFFLWMFRHLPGFNKFRGLSKFIYPAVLFLILLAGIGFDALLVSGVPAIGLILALVGTAFALGLTAQALLAGGSAFIGRWMQGIYATGEMYLPKYVIARPSFQAHAAEQAADSLFLAAGSLLVLSLALLAGRRWRRIGPIAVLALACVEMLHFATGTLETFSLDGAQNSPASDYLAEHPAPAGSRILNLENPNLAMSIGARDLWGYDPGVVRRYAEWIAASQGIDPDSLDEEIKFGAAPALYGSLLRCRYIFAQESLLAENGGVLPVIESSTDRLAPRLSLVTGFQVIAARDRIFAALADPAFDPRKSVILEAPPQPSPVAGDGPPGTAQLLAETTDSLLVEADLSRPAILVIADTFCSGWTVSPLSATGEKSSEQSTYQIVPADYFLRGIPLQAGRHRLLVAYRPMAFIVGAWISSVTLALYLLAGAVVWRRSFGRAAAG